MKTALIALATALTLQARPATAADAWLEVKSPHFTVLSNAGDKRARDVAWQFEQIRSAIVTIWPWVRSDLDRPVLVLAAKDENTMKLLTPEYWEDRGRSHPDSVFVSAPDRHYIALRADARAEDTNAINPYYASYWSYSALLLGQSIDRDLPLWFRNGLAGVLSNTIVRENEIRLGMAPPWYLRTLAGGPRLRLPQMLTLQADSQYYRDPTTRQLFDAQTWGFMHYLLFGLAEDPANRSEAVLQAIINGTPSMDAFQKVFGGTDAVEGAYVLHVRKELIPYRRLRAETRVAASAFASRPMPDPDALASRAALHAAMGRAADARTLLAEARQKADPAAAHEVDFLLAAAEENRAAMRASLLNAEQRGSPSFYALYRLATVELPDGRPDAAALALAERRLQKAVELNPFHAESLASLAHVVALGPPESRLRAVPMAQKAVTLDPGDAFVRATIARALWNAGQRDVAMQQAQTALRLATNDQARQNAQQLIDFFTKSASAPR